MATTVTLKPNAIDLSGSTSGTTTLQATAVAGTTVLTLPAATDTLVGRATTDTLTNKTLTTPTISQLTSAAATALTLQSAGVTAVTADTNQNIQIGTTSQIKSSKLSIYSGETNATMYNTVSLQGGSVVTIQNQKTTSVSTSAVTIATTGIFASLAIVYGSDGTNRFQDLIMVGLGTGTINVVSSLSVSGTPSSRTYSQASSTYKLAMGSGTYDVQFSCFSHSD
jgi:hypothetical protein